MHTRLTLAIAACVGLALPGTASAVDRHTRTLAATCMACHGPDGKSLGKVPNLAGQNKGAFVEAMQDFKSGARRATIMKRHASGYTDAEIEAMGEFFASLK